MFSCSVRKHRAPNGALRPDVREEGLDTAGQKAPSAKRCIKTPCVGECLHDGEVSESTERQTVH